MANLLTRKELAALVNRMPQQIGVYVKRGHLIEENKRIDTDNPVNKAWIAKNTITSLKESTNNIKPKAKPKPKQKIQIPDNFEFDEKDIMGMPVLTIDALKKKKEIKKIEIQTKKEELEYLKKKEKVLPIEFVIDWAGRNMRGVFGETINFGNSIIEQLCNQLGAEIDVKLEYKKKFKQGFQEVLQAGIKNQEPEALEMAKEYSIMSKW